MYKKVKFDKEKGWIELDDFKTLTDVSIKEDNVYVFYVGGLPKNKDEKNQIIDQVIKANKNEITRVVIGAQITVSKDSRLNSCGHACWCLVSDGARYCETCYCNENGYCWCVKCPSSC